MKKPKAIIIDNSEKIRNKLKDNLEKKIKNDTNIAFDCELYHNYSRKIHDKLTQGDIYFIDYHLPSNRTGDVVAKKLRDSGVNAPMVLLGGRENWPEEDKELSFRSERDTFNKIQEWIRGGLFQDVIVKPFRNKDSSDVITRLIEKELLINPISLGVVGLGRLVLETVKKAVEQPQIGVKSVDIYSQYFNENDRQTYHEHKEVINSDKIKELHPSARSLLETNPDVLFIATGVRYSNGKIPTRIEEFEKTAPKVYSIFKEIIETGYDNLVMCASNPFEILMRIGLEMGLNPNKMVGESVTDSVRTKKLASKGLVKGPYLEKKEESIDPYDIDIDVIGSHKKPIPLFSTASVKGAPLSEYGNYKEFRERFTQWLRGMGKRVMKGADKIGTYSDAPLGSIEMLSDITHMRKRPRSCWGAYDTANNNYYFTSVPVNIEYPSLNIHSQKVKNLDAWEKEELEKQKSKNFDLQRKLAGNFLKRVEN
ncbi:hypothetical protein GF378_01715 [Candidatus Pacearchaeota archaeon]|nr:hypothetical protein [Candidatus Pacearchaeota archaeon]